MSPRGGLGNIAIIGMACRFPGAGDTRAFWRNLQDGVESIHFFSDAALLKAGVSPEALEDPAYVKAAPILPAVDEFDASFFGYSPREAGLMDPQHRLLLETAWEAFEDAGYRPDTHEGVVGAFTGAGGVVTSYLVAHQHLDPGLPGATGSLQHIGNDKDFLSTRLSYKLNLTGPSITVQTACSTSLVALHLACQSLRDSECDAALVGASVVRCPPERGYLYTGGDILSPDGHCRAFDRDALGTVFGSGVAAVLLKRLEDAIADGDNIYAVIKGTAINNDGAKKTSYTASSALGQARAMVEAMEIADITADTISYVECHGTGTPMGDPIEVQALTKAFRRSTKKSQFCAIGSVKTNIGHLEQAAGLAGLIKVALALRSRQIPASLHFKTPNPKIDFAHSPFFVNTERREWEGSEARRRAAINGLGLGGTNAFVVLEEAPEPAPHPATADRRAHIFTISAQTDASLAALAGKLGEHLSREPAAKLADVCYTANVSRSQMPVRLSVVASSLESLKAKLEAAAQGHEVEGVSRGSAKPEPVVFLFSGQGAQYPRMGAELYRTQPEFRATLDRCDALCRPYLERPLLEVMFGTGEAGELVHQTAYTQPSLVALEVGLAELWRAWGVEPAAVLGHSVGEIAAACVAGALDLDHAMELACRRGALMQGLPERAGGMASVSAARATVEELIFGLTDRLSIAAVNSPTSVVISGDLEALREAAARAATRGLQVKELSVSHAFHSAHMDPILDALLAVAEAIPFSKPSLTVLSNLTGAPLTGPPTARYFRDHARGTVLFAEAMRTLAASGPRRFVEIGPGSTLLSLGRQAITDTASLWLPSLSKTRNDWDTLLESTGALYTHGHSIDWKAQARPHARRRVSLPTYAWQRQRYWIDGAPEARSRPATAAPGHPLLGDSLSSSVQRGTRFWEQVLSAEAPSYLSEHRVQGEIVLPGAAYVEMALAAAADAAVAGATTPTLEEMAFEHVLVVPSKSGRKVQVVLTEEERGRASIVVSSLEGNGSWTRHATVRMRRDGPEPRTIEPTSTLEELERRCPVRVSHAEHYRRMTAAGLSYGPSFQGVEQAWVGTGEVLGRVVLPDEARAGGSAYQIHPALLDACFQVLAILLGTPDGGAPGGTYIPVQIERIRVLAAAGQRLWVHGRLRPGQGLGAEVLTGDLRLIDDRDQSTAEIRGLRFKRVGSTAAKAWDRDEGLLYEVQWKRLSPAPESPVPDGSRGAFLLLEDQGGTGAALAALLHERNGRLARAVVGERYARLEPGLYQLNPADAAGIQALLRDAFNDGYPCRGVVHMWSLDATRIAATTARTIEADQILGAESALSVAQALLRAGGRDAPKLWLITRGARAVGAADLVSVAQAPLWGLGRVLALEHPELGCKRVDLDPTPSAYEASALLRELDASDGEDQIALRADGRYAARLSLTSFESAASEAPSTRLEPAAGQPFRLEARAPFVLEHLSLQRTERRPPGPLEVEIAVESAGLNFLDVLLALGVLPDDAPGAGAAGPRLGGECSGTIVRVGEGVTELREGDEVLALCPQSFSSFVTTRSALCARKPEHLGFSEAASLPIVFLTAYHALCHVARLRKGERVLIHAGAGGVGMAAIQWAQHVGAEIFATAGNEEKRALLRSLSVPYVMDSRSLAFVTDVLRFTNGQGIDVVLNSLSGDFISASFGLLRPYGRFVELGKRDYYQNNQLGLRPFLKNLSFSLVDLRGMAQERPELVSSLLGELMALFHARVLEPVPCQPFPISRAVEAFTAMAEARHVGKITLSMRDPDAQVEALPRTARTLFEAEESYLITGGLGGLGLSIAGWMVANGARHVALLGRSAPGSAARAAVEAMEAAGAKVVVINADVSRERELAAALAEITARLPPLRGVVHAAGLLDDGTARTLDPERLRAVMAPKVQGAWNLHAQTLGLPLRFFVLYSSAVSLVGSPGQGNYAAANAFLDALAQHRCKAGLPAMSINWGPFSEVGMAAAEPTRGKRLAGRGLENLTPPEGLRVLGRLLAAPRAQVGVMRFELRHWLEFYPHDAASRFWADLAAERVQEVRRAPLGARLWTSLERADPSARQPLVEQFVREQIGRVLRLDPARIERHAPLTAIGMDSLMGIELRNRLEAELGVYLPSTLLWICPHVAALAEHLLAFVSVEPELAPLPSPAEPEANPSAAQADIALLSEDELIAELQRELDSGVEWVPFDAMSKG